jgi:uncharacterized protein (TIGR00255 family)
MTGYGRGECAQDGLKIAVEISSVNRKQAELAINLPRELEVLESRIRDEINRHISRGRLTVRVSVHAADARLASRVKLDTALARAYLRELNHLAKELKLSDQPTLDSILRVPGVIQTERGVDDADEFWPAIEKALKQSLARLLKMRDREGAHLAKDMKGRMKLIQEATTRIRAHAPLVAERFREQLLTRIKAAGLDLPGVDDDRVLKEVVFFADRSDISEELTRLESHFVQFRDALKARESVGRMLDFLAQEMNREVNTIGSKANDSLISREVVVLKAELEKFREQAQNVE